MIEWPRYTCAAYGCEKSATCRLLSDYRPEFSAEYCNEHLTEWARAMDKLGQRYRVFNLDD